MADRPIEYELMMSAYTQIGRDLADSTSHLDAYVPSGAEENDLGFDIQIPYLKGIVFQFKRPKGDDPRRFGVRYSEQDPPRQLDRMLNWGLKFGDHAAYYAFPLVVNHDDLSETLHRTAFIPATEIHPMASVVRVPEGYIQNGEQQGHATVTVYCSDPDNTSQNCTRDIAPSAVVGWKGLKRRISQCDAGFRMRWANDPYYNQYHDGHLWYPRENDEIAQSDVSRASRFIESRSPMFTRIGSSDAFDW